MERLTTAFILRRRHIKPIILYQNQLIVKKKSPYFLLIYSTSSDYTKLTIYPIDTNIILKLILSGKNLTNNSIGKIVEVLNKFKIIHTSGIVAFKDKFLYELYISGHFGWKDEITNYYYILKKIEGIEKLEEEWIRYLSKIKLKYLKK
ncbi:MAG: hypothetical protein ACTSRZ_19470 [Promethearchaeota archaeon]